MHDGKSEVASIPISHSRAAFTATGTTRLGIALVNFWGCPKLGAWNCLGSGNFLRSSFGGLGKCRGGIYLTFR